MNNNNFNIPRGRGRNSLSQAGLPYTFTNRNRHQYIATPSPQRNIVDGAFETLRNELETSQTNELHFRRQAESFQQENENLREKLETLDSNSVPLALHMTVFQQNSELRKSNTQKLEKLKTEKKLLEEDVQNLKRQLECEKSSKTVIVLQNENLILQSKLTYSEKSNKSNVEKLVAEIAAEKNKVLDSERAYKDAISEISTWKDKFDKLNDQIKGLNSDNKKNSAELENFQAQNQLPQGYAEAEHLQKENDILRLKVETLEHEKKSLKGDYLEIAIRNMSDHVENLQNLIKCSHENMELSAKVKKLDNTNDDICVELSNNIAGLKKKLKLNQAELKNLTEQLGQKDSLSDKLKSASDEVSSLRAANRNLTNNGKKLEEENKNLKIKIVELGDKIKEKELNSKNLDEIRQLNEFLREQELDILKLRENGNKLSEKNQSLQLEKEALRHDYDLRKAALAADNHETVKKMHYQCRVIDKLEQEISRGNLQHKIKSDDDLDTQKAVNSWLEDLVQIQANKIESLDKEKRQLSRLENESTAQLKAYKRTLRKLQLDYDQGEENEEDEEEDLIEDEENIKDEVENVTEEDEDEEQNETNEEQDLLETREFVSTGFKEMSEQPDSNPSCKRKLFDEEKVSKLSRMNDEEN